MGAGESAERSQGAAGEGRRRAPSGAACPGRGPAGPERLSTSGGHPRTDAATATASFYDGLAADHHLVFADWPAALERQAGILGPLIGDGSSPLDVLDCACGIGTQALGLAALGHRVTASDLSPGAIGRAREEAARRGLAIRFVVADMRHLERAVSGRFDAVLCIDNALPHLDSTDDLLTALRAISARLRPGGRLLVSIRDYDRALVERPRFEGPRVHDGPDGWRIVHQLWEWLDERRYRAHLFITREGEDGWISGHHAVVHRALRRAELSHLMNAAGLVDVTWLLPDESGFYQPIVRARAG